MNHATKSELQASVTKLTEQLCTANIEISHLRAQLADRDHLTRRLIKRVNKTVSPRRAAMEAAREEAMRTGKKVVVSHV